MKYYLCIVLFFGCLSISFSQKKEESNLNNYLKINYYFTGLEFSYEIPLNNKFLFEAGAGIGAGSYIEEIPFVGESFSISFESLPVLRLRGKLIYIYNRGKRLNNKKNINFNSGNYIALKNTFSSEKKDLYNNVLMSNFVWGIQRNIGGKWLLNIDGGFGYAKDFNTNLDRLYPSIGLEFSYVIF